MTAEWKDASESGRRPRWNVFTDTYLKQVCDQVAIANPQWHPDLYATNISTYIAGMTSRKMWWVLPGSRTSAAQGSANGAC